MSDNIITDGNGAAHNGAGMKGAGEFTHKRLADQPEDVTLARAPETVRSPSRELGFQLTNLFQQTTAVQTREDLQTTLRNLRKINPSIAQLEVGDDGEGNCYLAAAWDADGNDITEGDWYRDGTKARIEQLTGGYLFPINDRPFDSEGSPMSTIATANDEHLAWDVDVDKALATNAADPAATTALGRLNAISRGSRALAAALEKVRISEGHAHIDAIEEMSKKLPAGVTALVITEPIEDDENVGPQAKFLGSDGSYSGSNSDDTQEILDLASNIGCSLWDLRDRGAFLFGDDELGNNELTIRFNK